MSAKYNPPLALTEMAKIFNMDSKPERENIVNTGPIYGTLLIMTLCSDVID